MHVIRTIAASSIVSLLTSFGLTMGGGAYLGFISVKKSWSSILGLVGAGVEVGTGEGVEEV